MKNELAPAAAPSAVPEPPEIARRIRKILRNSKSAGFLRVAHSGVAPEHARVTAELIELDELRNGFDALAEELSAQQ